MERSSKEFRDDLESARVVPGKKHHLLHLKKTSVLMTDWNRPSTSAAYYEADSSDDKISDGPGLGLEESTSVRIANPVILKFEEWMLSPDRGRRDAKAAEQHSDQLLRMLKAIDDQEDRQSLLDLPPVRNVFLKSHVVTKNYEVGTIKSYLMSLRHFFWFLLSDKA